MVLGINDGDGTESDKVSITDPSISAIGKTLGIGVKKANGYFKYYDGKILGSTNAKPDTTTEVEKNYEVVTYKDSNNYEYTVLEFMK